MIRFIFLIVLLNLALFSHSFASENFQQRKDNSIIYYKSVADKLSPHQKKSLSLIINLMQREKLPVLFPEADSKDSQRMTELDLLRYKPAGMIDNKYHTSFGDHIVTPKNGEEIDTSGGNHWIKNRIIFVINKNWGKIKFDTPCGGGLSDKYQNDEYAKFWNDKDFKRTNFWVFGNDINPEDLYWETPFKLVHKTTNDTIEVTSSSWCANIVFTEGGKLQPFNWSEYYERL